MTQTYNVRAFCRQENGGNKAGVVIMQDMLDDSEMQDIAAKLGFPETAFVQKKIDGNFRVFFYTPIAPIDFCGHASLAAFGVLREREQIPFGVYELETDVGFVEITVTSSTIYLSQILPQFNKILAREELEDVLGVELSHDYKPQIVSTGIRSILVPLPSHEVLYSIKPNFSAILDLCEKHEVIDVHAFAMDPRGSESTAHCRNFAPLVGIPEEPATGTANGSLACYLFHHGLDKKDFLFKQGDHMKAPSDIQVRLYCLGQTIEKVECGGEVVVDGVQEV